MEVEGADGSIRQPVVRALSFHSAYRCQNTGVCCSSGWDIAVEGGVEARLTKLLGRTPQRLPNGPGGFRPMPDPPANCKSALRLVESTGACWFRDESGRTCALHRDFGEDVLPSACRQFPRICVIEPDVVSVSLSHYCPTAAGLLFGDADAFGLVTEPKAFPSTWPFEGLDARHAYPPFLRPGVLLGFDGLRILEEQAVGVLSRESLWPAMEIIDAAVEGARSWTAEAGSVCERVVRSFVSRDGHVDHGPLATDPRPILLGSLTEGTVPSAGLPPFQPGPPALSALADLALRKYLASRLIAAWITFQADDLRSVVKYLRLCLNTALLFASARTAGESEGTRWREAIRTTDLWILHYSDPDLLARNLR